jgi:aminopeptidase N
MTPASLTREEAETRSSLIEVTRYDIETDFRGLLEGDTLVSTSTITFSCHSPGSSSFVDVVGEVREATLNGATLDLSTHAEGRLPLPELAADNVLVVTSAQSDTSSSNGIQRTVDPSDKEVYVWTSLEADEARRVWACFDQPDLKAPHKFTVHAPDHWLVTSNGAPDSIEDDPTGGRVWTYPDTPPLSTYVVVVNAGAFHEVRVQADGYDLGFYCRRSLVPHLERDLDELVTLTRQGLAWFGEKFGLPFPQERYDQVFVPNLGGAMENWGCVTYGDAQLFRTPPTYAQRELRAEFVMHEMAHMWFGDLVTMQWWDDLWLNEAFASWAASWASASATEFSDAWASHLAQYKRTAYEMDMSPATHPIRSDVGDVSQAMANFDAITYVKGQSVLQQLCAYIGEDAFLAGLQSYFAKHQWGNTRLTDLMTAFGNAAGLDLTDWTSAWLDRTGPDVLTLEGDTVTATSPDSSAPRPHRFDIASFRDDEVLTPTGVTEVRLREESLQLDGLEGDLHLVNAGDLTYAVARPDERSQELMFDRVADLPDPLSRALVINTGTQLLLRGELAPRVAASAVTKALSREQSPSLIEPFAGMAYSYSDRWAPPAESEGLKSALADAVLDLSRQPQHAQAALRTLAQTASTTAHWDRLEEAKEQASDFDLTWRMLARRAELDALDLDEVDRVLEADPDPDAGIRRLMVLAEAPSVEAKEEVWKAFFTDHSVPASRETLILGSMFWRPAQADLLEPFTYRYLEELGRLTGGLLNQGVVIRAMYPQGVGDAAYADAAESAAGRNDLSHYAQAQVKSATFVLRQILRARTL